MNPHLEIATKQDLRARPTKIVAGLEAEKTNEFLIAIARAIDRKVYTTDAVALVKSGNVASTQKKEPKAAGGAKTANKIESRTKGARDANESKKGKSSDTKLPKKTDGGGKKIAAATKQSSKDSNDVKKSKSQSRERKESDKKSSPKNDVPEMKVKPNEPQPNVVNVIQNTNGNATVSVTVFEFQLKF